MWDAQVGCKHSSRRTPFHGVYEMLNILGVLHLEHVSIHCTTINYNY